jgi:hypothetical protein
MGISTTQMALVKGHTRFNLFFRFLRYADYPFSICSFSAIAGFAWYLTPMFVIARLWGRAPYLLVIGSFAFRQAVFRICCLAPINILSVLISLFYR